MTIDPSIKKFINNPNEYFLCKQGKDIFIEKRGLCFKKWIYTIARSDRYDLAKVSRQVQQILQNTQSSTSFATPKLIATIDEKIDSHNTKVNKLGGQWIPRIESRSDTLRKILKVVNGPKLLAKVEPGLNMLGTCTTDGCENYNKLTIVPKGFGEGKVLDIAEQCCKTTCPACKETMNFDNVNDIIITGATFKLEARNTKQKRIEGIFQIKNDEPLRIDIRDLLYMELQLQTV